MEVKDEYVNIRKMAINIEQIVYLLENIKGAEYIKDYKLKDIQNLDKIIKKCKRCGNDFIPNPNFKQHQRFCDIRCRNQSTRAHKYELKLDERQRPIDLLRKAIYERKYRAIRDNVDINIKEYKIILKKLTALVKVRWNMTEKEYNKRLSDLQYKYDQLVKCEKESIKNNG